MEEKEQEKGDQININNNLPGRTKNSIINNISKAAAAVVYANSKKNTSINSSSKFSGSDSEHTSQQSHGVFRSNNNTTTNSACSGLKNTNFSFFNSQTSSFFKHFEYHTSSSVNNTVRPITLDFLGSDDEIDEGVIVTNKSSTPCTNSIKLWKNSSFMSKTTGSSPPRTHNARTSPNNSDDRDGIKIIENGIKILPPPSKNLEMTGTLIKPHETHVPTHLNPTFCNNLTTSYSYHSGMSTALLLHSPIDRSFKQNRFESWLEVQKQSVETTILE